MNKKWKMCSLITHSKKTLAQKDGTTMVEVMIAFLIVAMSFAMFAKSISFVGNMMAKYQDTEKSYEQFQADYYKNKGTTSCEKKTSGFALQVDTQKTDTTYNQCSDNSANPIEMNDAALYVYQKDAENDSQTMYYITYQTSKQSLRMQ